MEKYIQDFHIPTWEELPDIDLYLDQVVTFIDKYLNNYIYTDTESNGEGKILTKTMINNYVKQKIIDKLVTGVQTCALPIYSPFICYMYFKTSI